MAVRFELAPGRWIGEGCPCFVIAEIGQNHQGDINIAKRLIDIAKECGADCIKFQKSSLERKFNQAALNRPYSGVNSWGRTYGEHKRFLEFSNECFVELQQHAKKNGILFSSSGMDETSIDFLNDIGVPFFKIGSGDANNFKLIAHTAKKGKPLLISSGMQTLTTMQHIYQLLRDTIETRFCFLQCTSCYPTLPENVNLRVIETYQKEFPDIPLGYSGHEEGIYVSVAAVAKGIKVLERHITLNKQWKGSDHTSSLEPKEFKELVSQVRVVEAALGSPEKCMLPCEIPCFSKLGKSIVSARPIHAGERISEDMLDVKVAEPRGVPAEEMHALIGRIAICNIKEDESIHYINTRDSDVVGVSVELE